VAITALPAAPAVEVTGLLNVKLSKSSLNWQTSVPLLQIVILHADPAVLEEEVKYVQFSATEPPPQLFSKIQHTPNELAQLPDDEPPFELHSELV